MGSPHGSEAKRLEGYPTGQVKFPATAFAWCDGGGCAWPSWSTGGQCAWRNAGQRAMKNGCLTFDALCITVMHMNNTLPPPTALRVTVPVSQEVHSAFQRLAKAGNMSVGRAMGEWLGDTIDAAGYLATTLERARLAPKLVAQELHAYALGMADESGAILQKMRKEGAAARGTAGDAQRPPLAPDLIPPSCNTGGKVPSGHKVKPTRGKP